MGEARKTRPSVPTGIPLSKGGADYLRSVSSRTAERLVDELRIGGIDGRRLAIIELGRRKERSAMESLVRTLKEDPDISCRSYAAIALGAIAMDAIGQDQLKDGKESTGTTVFVATILGAMKDVSGPLVGEYHRMSGRDEHIEAFLKTVRDVIGTVNSFRIATG